jgi:hypothetical protein
LAKKLAIYPPSQKVERHGHHAYPGHHLIFCEADVIEGFE